MVVTQSRPKRTKHGSRYTAARKKRRFEKGNKPILTKLGEKDVKSPRTLGGNSKVKLAAGNTVNLTDPKAKKTSKVDLKAVLENPANRHFVRRNIITKGTLIDTEKGKARVTSRPGQDGSIDAVLV
jgi:small subunit ribosomal protein S8e